MKVSVDENLKESAEDERIRKKQKKAEERCFDAPVNMSKVSMPVVKRWIMDTLGEQLPDDDVAVEFIYELLVGSENDEPDIGAIREQMNDFLGIEESRAFCLGLWRLLLSAQESPNGVPQQVVEGRKLRMEEDENARRETHLILQRLRPKLSFARSRSQVSFQEPQAKNTIKPAIDENRVGKPNRKTNYNRC